MSSNGQQAIQPRPPMPPAPPRPRPPAEQTAGDDFLTRMQAQADFIRDTARWFGERGENDVRDCAEFADHLDTLTQQFIGKLITRKRADIDLLERRMRGRDGAAQDRK